MGFKRLSSSVTGVRGHHGPLCLDTRCAAVIAALYSIISSFLVVLFYGWRFIVNSHHPRHLREVYWGVQIAYLATIATHLTLMAFSFLLMVAIHKERLGVLTQWVVVFISLMVLEAVCCCYSNVLRDHVNKRFDSTCKTEIAFFILRVTFNILSLWSVLRFLKFISSGFSYRDPETIEL